MTNRETAPIGAPCWVDLLTSDTERARAFYGGLFGWTAEEPASDFGGYFMFSKGGMPVAGCMGRQPGMEQPDVWSTYLASDDARKTVDTAVANGGDVIVPAMDVGDIGTMAVVSDAVGARIGIWQPALFHGFGLLGEIGTPKWFELHTRDYEAAVGFYREVFHWEPQVVSDTPAFRLTTISDGGEQLAGIMDASSCLAEGEPARWEVYFEVDRTDDALAMTTELGGQVLEPGADTPFGRLAATADPTGARFKLVGSA
jgi:hypothetical protein